MCANFFGLAALLVATLVSVSECKKVHHVHWNRASPLFRIDNTDHILDVKEFDQVNLICPVAKPGEPRPEAHVVYSVSREEYEACRVTDPKPRIVAVCNQPHRLMYFTITFRSFTPTPGGLEFRPGQDYYFISTSSRDDLHRRAGGGCSAHNMRMVFKVHPNPTVRDRQQELLREAERERQAREDLEEQTSWQRGLDAPRINSIDDDDSETTVPRYRVSNSNQVVRDAGSRGVFYYHPRDVLMAAASAGRSASFEDDEDVLDMLIQEEDAFERRRLRSLPFTSSSSSTVASSFSISVALTLLIVFITKQ